jgi:hypothetical protein
MAYIPKNKIQTNLYTSGGEYIYASSKVGYVGPYYKLYNGKSFTGQTPNSPNTQEIILAPRTNGQNSRPLLPSSLPILYSPLLPTPQDYKIGVFTRYFSLKRNQAIFTEISQDTYDKFQQKDPNTPWQFYKTFSLSWELTGDINKVAQTNKNITELTESREKAFGLGLYLKENWTQYYKGKS